MSITQNKVVVAGGGLMGTGIAHAFASSGFVTVLVDSNEAAAAKALSAVAKILDDGVRLGKLDAAVADAAKSRLTTQADLAAASAGAALLVETVTENIAVKKQVVATAAAHMLPDAIIATNTSALSVTEIATAVPQPDRVVGMHFFNPVHKMKLVELVRGIATEEKTFLAAKQFVDTLDKTTTVAEDFPAFIVNRILLPMINEAIYTLYEGVGTVDAIDTALKLGANHPMGPLELGDFIGLDTVLSIMNVLYEGLADSKYRPCPLLVKYVEAGWLGRKAGRGFYDYRGEKPVPTR